MSSCRRTLGGLGQYLSRSADVPRDMGIRLRVPCRAVPLAPELLRIRPLPLAARPFDRFGETFGHGRDRGVANQVKGRTNIRH